LAEQKGVRDCLAKKADDGTVLQLTKDYGIGIDWAHRTDVSEGQVYTILWSVANPQFSRMQLLFLTRIY